MTHEYKYIGATYYRRLIGGTVYVRWDGAKWVDPPIDDGRTKPRSFARPKPTRDERCA